MDSPVVLKVSHGVVVICIRNDERPLRNRAANGDCKQQIFVVDHAIPIAILVGEVLYELDRPRLEHAEIEICTDALELAPKVEVVASSNPVEIVSELRALLACLLGHTVRRSIGETGKVQLRAYTQRRGCINEVVERVASSI